MPTTTVVLLSCTVSSEQSEGILVLISDKLIRIRRETEVIRRDDDLYDLYFLIEPIL